MCIYMKAHTDLVWIEPLAVHIRNLFHVCQASALGYLVDNYLPVSQAVDSQAERSFYVRRLKSPDPVGAESLGLSLPNKPGSSSSTATAYSEHFAGEGSLDKSQAGSQWYTTQDLFCSMDAPPTPKRQSLGPYSEHFAGAGSLDKSQAGSQWCITQDLCAIMDAPPTPKRQCLGLDDEFFDDSELEGEEILANVPLGSQAGVQLLAGGRPAATPQARPGPLPRTTAIRSYWPGRAEGQLCKEKMSQPIRSYWPEPEQPEPPPPQPEPSPAPAPGAPGPERSPGPVPIPRVTLLRATKKRGRKPEEREEHERRRRVNFNIAEAMDADADAVKALLFGWKLPKPLYNALRAEYCDYYKENHAAEAESMSVRDFRAAARCHFAKAGNPLKIKLLKKMLERQDTLSGMWSDIKMLIAKLTYPGKDPNALTRDRDRQRCQVGLWVYNDKKWFLEPLAKEEDEEAWDSESLVARAKDLPEVKEVWERFEKFIAEKARELGAEHAVSLELSLGTYGETGQVRFHLNVALTRAQAFRFTNPWGVLEFEKAPAIYKPKMSDDAISAKTRKTGRNMMWAQAAYYLQFPKEGAVYTGGSVAPYKHYQVRPRWVTEYVQAGTLASHAR